MHSTVQKKMRLNYERLNTDEIILGYIYSQHILGLIFIFRRCCRVKARLVLMIHVFTKFRMVLLNLYNTLELHVEVGHKKPGHQASGLSKTRFLATRVTSKGK